MKPSDFNALQYSIDMKLTKRAQSNLIHDFCATCSKANIERLNNGTLFKITVIGTLIFWPNTGRVSVRKNKLKLS